MYWFMMKNLEKFKIKSNERYIVKFKWIKFNPKMVRLPKERKPVFVRFQNGGVCIGYLRRWSNRTNFFVTPGINREDEKVTHFSDTLDCDFKEIYKQITY